MTNKPSRQARRALVAGVRNRLGEALLNAVLARGGYQQTLALADQVMSLGVRGLELTTLDTLPPVDDVYLLPAQPGDDAHTYHGRDLAYAALPPQRLLQVASHAQQQGATRLLLLSPAPAWQQLSGVNAGLTGEHELALSQLQYETMVLMRPLGGSSVAGQGWLARFIHTYLSVQMLMMPKSLPTLTSDKIAQAAVSALQSAKAGVSVIGASQIEQASQPATIAAR